MKRRNPPNVHSYENRHGKIVFYFRRPGQKKIRLRIDDGVLPWSPAFMAAYELAKHGTSPSELGAARTVPGTVNASIVSYYQSSAFRDGLAKSTQGSRRAILESFRNDHGSKRVALMHSAALQNIFNSKSPAAQRNWMKALRGWVDHCLALKMIRKDSLADVKLVKLPRTGGHHPWETGECEQFEQHHAIGTRARLAYELLLQAGQSRCDVVRMGRQHIRNGMMTMGRQKTGVPFNVEVMPRLQAAVDAMPASDHLTFLVTAQGKPFTAAGFGNYFRDCCRDAGLPDRCTSHGLRKAAATYLAELGFTDHQLMAWFGWTSISQAQVYTRAASRKRMAREGAKLISGTGIGSPSDPVSQNQSQPIEKTGVGK
ncbi:tyrosine-type recombinase/integrase [Bradyrhizobium elkanii]|uniref:tyrosine-type recombinase/integrase n=1 Tax=Bradyrhizobium elkanii TaxID=29448 RepID=UPI002225F031|nr:tyrosine-type recombinase/integrase [Bradyrhizobium elkanii]MCW2227211.1 integrase [Bradyrhizobium elkanii]